MEIWTAPVPIPAAGNYPGSQLQLRVRFYLKHHVGSDSDSRKMVNIHALAPDPTWAAHPAHWEDLDSSGIDPERHPGFGSK